MEFIRTKKEIKRPPSNRNFLCNNKRPAQTLHYWDDRVGISSESEVVQCAPRDRKTEKWKQGRGRLGWKYGRKTGFDMKHQTFGEDTDVTSLENKETVLHPIVSDIMREADFDETHYSAPTSMLLPLFWGVDSPRDPVLCQYIDRCCRRYNFEIGDPEVEQIIEVNGEEILRDYPVIKKYVTETGNCGGLADFLYEEKEESSEGNFDVFIEELGQEVPIDTVKLIRVQANIGHAFTLICYKQNDETVIELIQAWQGEYSVKKSLDSAAGNFYVKDRLVHKFRVMHESIKSKQGSRYFNEVFLGVVLDKKKNINNLEITHLNIKNLVGEKPETYAERIAKRRIDAPT